MRNLLGKLLSVGLLTIGVLILIAPLAQAEDQCQCQPFSGTLYGWNTGDWDSVGDITIGKKVHHATLLAVNTSFIDDGDIWYATETWTFDFGGGDTLQVKTHAVTEHMTDAASASGVFHVIEVGTVTNGTGVFKHAYGNLISPGPFGWGVKLPDNVVLPPDAPAWDGQVWFWVGPLQGMICGISDHDERRD